MSETFQQLNFMLDGRRTAGQYEDERMQAIIDQGNAAYRYSETNFRAALDNDNLNERYASELAEVEAYFESRGVQVDPLRVVTREMSARAHAAAKRDVAVGRDTAQGYHASGRSVIIEHPELTDMFGPAYIIGMGLHESGHSRSDENRLAIVNEREHGSTFVSRKVMSGQVRVDLRHDAESTFVGEFWEEAVVDLGRVRALREMGRSNDFVDGHKESALDDLDILVVSNGSMDPDNPDLSHTSALTLPAEFTLLAHTNAAGRNQTGISSPNLAAYALELLDRRLPGLYDDFEASLAEPTRRSHAIRKIESLSPGLYYQLDKLVYSSSGFVSGLRTVMDVLAKR